MSSGSTGRKCALDPVRIEFLSSFTVDFQVYLVMIFFTGSNIRGPKKQRLKFRNLIHNFFQWLQLGAILLRKFRSGFLGMNLYMVLHNLFEFGSIRIITLSDHGISEVRSERREVTRGLPNLARGANPKLNWVRRRKTYLMSNYLWLANVKTSTNGQEYCGKYVLVS